MIAKKDFIVYPDEDLEQLGLLDQYIIQKKEGYRFTIDPFLLAYFTKVNPCERILDLGTGGGILPFLLYKNNRDKNITMTGIDIQKSYVDMAERSRRGNGIKEISFINEDIRNMGKEYALSYDIVMTNPPFFKEKEGKISPKNEIAIARHELLVDFQTIIQKAACCLKPKGRFIFIQRSERLTEIAEYLKKEKFCITQLQFIYPNLQSGSKLFMASAVRAQSRQMQVDAPVIIYEDDGRYTEKVRNMYV